jgi:hypothetical protein
MDSLSYFDGVCAGLVLSSTIACPLPGLVLMASAKLRGAAGEVCGMVLADDDESSLCWFWIYTYKCKRDKCKERGRDTGQATKIGFIILLQH